MDPNDAVPSGTFSEEEKLPEGMDEDSSWFTKNLGDESDNTEGMSSQINQDELSQGNDDNTKPTEEAMETDSPSELLSEITEKSKKKELTELKDIEINSKKHDISNELKEMFEEKSSDAEELQETSLTKHSLDTDITKEDKLKDIVPDDILGKDDSFDELDNDALHQELEAHLTYDKSEQLSELNSESSISHPQEGEHDSQKEAESGPEMTKLDELSFEGKTELLNDITENIGTKEIDEIMQESNPVEEEDNGNKTISEDKEISKDLISELKEDLDNQIENVTDETSAKSEQTEENTENENIGNIVDKENIELNQENMMVEFAHGSGNQVLIQINTDKSETNEEDSGKSEGIVMETSDGQTLVFSSSDAAEPDDVSQVEGGAEFLQAVTGKLEDVLATEPEKEPDLPSTTATQSPTKATPVDKKEVPSKDSPRCCVPTCKSGKTGLKTTYRFFKPPVNKILYKKWEYVFKQAKQELTPELQICELHFRTGLIYKRGIDKFGKVLWALRDGALPKLTASSGLLRLGGVPPSTTVQVPKKPESLIKPATSPTKSVSPSAAALAGKSASPGTSAAGIIGTPKVLGKKILQKPVKTVATKVSNEVTDIGFLYKNPELVKGKKLIAQDDLANLDVLVCGECHAVFHILELFQAHKLAANCKGESNFKGNPAEPKPQVWAFLLWKSAQAKVSDVESSWRLYQRWCKMDEKIRNVWIAAGRSLQEGNAIASLKLTDTSPIKTYPKPGRPALKKDSDDEEHARKIVKRKPGRPPGSGALSASVTEPAVGDIGGGGDLGSATEPMDVGTDGSPDITTGDMEVDQTLDSINRRTPEMITSEVEIKQEVVSDDEHDENKENSRKNVKSDEIQNCDKCKRPISNPKGGVLCAGGCYGYYHIECTRLKTHSAFSKLGVRKAHWKCDFCKAMQLQLPPQSQRSAAKQKQPEKSQPQVPSSAGNEEEEFVVEKIVSRRYNIKKKHYEYLLKWEGYPSEQNTWEPAENLGTCQHLLKAFEEALAKQQAAKQAGLGKQSSGGGKQETPYRIKPPVVPNKRPPPTPVTTSAGRPQRSSKQKAMDQVKQWCGSIVKPTDDDGLGLKRKLSESDSEYEGEEDDVVVKKVKVERDSEDSDSDGFKQSLGRPRNRPPLATTPRTPNTQVNGENLAAELGLESEEEDNTAASSPQKSPVVRKMSTLSPSKQQVLVASAKGVVTMDQKQIPNLSSGVYIMSNKSGIVKVDNNKTLSTLQKSGVLKKPFVKSEKSSEDSSASPQKSSSGVVVLPRSEAGTPQQKVGVIRKTIASTPTTQTTTTSPGTPKPTGLLKPLKSGLSPRPSGLLKPTGSPMIRPQNQTPNANAKIQPMLKPRLSNPGRGRPPISPLIKRPLASEGGLHATPQQKLLIAKKKAEIESEVRPEVTASPMPRPLVKPKLEPGLPTPPIKSTNKILTNPLLARGRGRPGLRGRGRGSSLSQIMHVREREPEPEPVKESRLVDSDNLLMEFQEPSDSEESDDGLEDIFPNLDELPPIEPNSPPRPLSLCPETGKVLCKAEGEKTPEPTPPPSPPPPTPPPAPPKVEEPTHILPEIEQEPEPEPEPVPVPAPVPVVTAPPVTAPVSVSVTSGTPRGKTTSTAIVKQDGMICKVEMSPGGTTGTLVEAISEAAAPSPHVTEGTVTIKKPRNRNLNRGPQLSVVPNTSSTSLGTITVPARKLFQEDTSDDNMVTITGEDGMVYQVSNSELTAGNTLLVSSEDGEQQCVYVTTGDDGGEGTILTLDSAYANAVAQLGSEQVNILSTEDGDQYFIKEDDVEGGEVMTLEGDEGLVAGDDQSGQVVAQLVEAGEPAPGGSRRVVLLLPDGNLMMTEVDEEQYAALDLDK
ncbi:uncharacterized protein LOC128984764 isoform X3 [Macrosteles quadrilineatus]|uniref:uncharacterized protein LOC128984764 isoform X3 n=1 Tax=Macrosteles quadrilineatus TaxID=74068 RepID=UPI0023E1EDC5|nr:uncharacterized protein LOC128984764 isoform X3 [Macrosteles quadrilineatus]